MRSLARRANQSLKPDASSAHRSDFAHPGSHHDTYAGAPAAGAQFSFADVPVTAPPLPVIPTVLAADDPSERAADDAAHQVMHKAEPTPIASTRASIPIAPAPRDAEGNVEAAVRAAADPGAPLPREVRAYFEPRFAHDFSRVRVHADREGANGAQAVGSLAYTIGDDIVFAPGKYEPGSPEGRRLLAHELAHVVQQSRAGGAGIAIQRDTPKRQATPPKPAKFYQAIIDAIADADADMARQLKEKKYPFMVHKPMNYEGLKALLPLAQAIDEERTADIPKLTDSFIAAEHPAPFRALSETLLIEMAARLFTLGLEAESSKLRANYSAGEKSFSFLNEDPGKARRDIAVYKATAERAISSADASSVEKIKHSVEVMVRVLDMLRDAILAVDQDLLRMEESDAWRRTFEPYMTWHAYWNALKDVLATLVGAIEAQLQTLMERAAMDLSEGRGGATLLVLRDLVENKLQPAIQSADGKKDIGGMTLPITRTEIKAGQGFVRDALSKDPKSRSVAVNTYTPGQESVRELQASLAGLLGIRIRQVATLARIYGATEMLRADKPEEKEKSADSARNAQTMKKLTDAGGKLRLDSDSDWRTFLLQKYKDMIGPDGKEKGKALSAVISLLFDYLDAFTVHARFTNIYDQGDFKDAYFDKPFPRSLAGQLVHDCGIYAMRVAYILSLVRQELDLRFRFIRLPAHVGLIITGDGFPTFFAHNDHFKEYSREELNQLYEGWNKLNADDPASKDSSKDAALDPALDPTADDQFLGELATVRFIEGPLDAPFALSDVPKAGKTAGATQQALWDEYQKIAKKDVFGPAATDKKSPGYLFHNRYLAITESYRQWSNEAVLPFWNQKAPKAWKTLETALKASGRKEILGSELKDLLEDHLKQIDEDMKPVNARLQGIHESERSLSRQLRDDPKLVAKGMRITRGGKIIAIHSWETYRENVQGLIAAAGATPAKKFGIAQDIEAALQPPFIPMPEKAMAIQY
jgi:hypothetical protein